MPETGNEQLARETFESLSRADFDSWVENFDPDVIYVPTREWPDAAPRRGRDAIRQFMEGVFDDWGKWEVTIRNLRGHHDRVLIETRIRAVGETSGLELRGRTFHVLTIDNGRITHMQDFIEPEEARRAAGLAT